MIRGDTDRETVLLNTELLGMSRERVLEALAIERGEVASDIIVVGEDGQPLPIEEQRAELGLEPGKEESTQDA